MLVKPKWIRTGQMASLNFSENSIQRKKHLGRILDIPALPLLERQALETAGLTGDLEPTYL